MPTRPMTPRPAGWVRLARNPEGAWVEEDATGHRRHAGPEGWVVESTADVDAWRWCRALTPADRQQAIRGLGRALVAHATPGGLAAQHTLWTTRVGARTDLRAEHPGREAFIQQVRRQQTLRTHGPRLAGQPEPVDAMPAARVASQVWQGWSLGWWWGLATRLRSWLDAHPNAQWHTWGLTDGMGWFDGALPAARRGGEGQYSSTEDLHLVMGERLPPGGRKGRVWCIGQGAAPAGAQAVMTPGGPCWSRPPAAPPPAPPMAWADWLGPAPTAAIGSVGAAEELVPWPPAAWVEPGDAHTPRALAEAMTVARTARRTVMSDPVGTWSRVMQAPTATVAQHLSADQMDGVTAAVLALDRGRGMVLGDAAGRGKGRVLATLMGWGVRSGHAVLAITENPGLFQDWWRDQVAADPAPPLARLLHNAARVRTADGVRTSLPASDQDAWLAHPGGPELVWTTYAHLHARAPARVAGLVAWLKANSGWLLLDESHDATGQGPVAAAVDRLVRAAGGRVVFASATFATRPEHLRIARPALPSDVPHGVGLERAMARGGVWARSALAAAMAEQGTLIRRDHPPPPAAEVFEPAPAARAVLRDADRAFADFAQAWWRHARAVAMALGQPPGMAWRHLGAPLNRMAREHLLLGRLPAMVEAIQARLALGDRVVVAVDATLEAALQGDATPTAADGMDEDVETLRVGQVTWRQRAWAMVRDVVPEDVLADIIDDPRVRSTQDVLVRTIAALPDWSMDPLGTLAMRLTAAGLRVGELSGRRTRLEGVGEAARPVAFRQPDRQATTAAFNAGDLDVLMVTRAGCTGISLHAGVTFACQARRALIEWDPPASPAHRAQFWGRVRRRDQVAEPVYLVLPADSLAAQRTAWVAQRKQAMLDAHVGRATDVGHEALAWEALAWAWAADHPEWARDMGLGRPGQRAPGGVPPPPVHERWWARAWILPETAREEILAAGAARHAWRPPGLPEAPAWRGQREWHAGVDAAPATRVDRVQRVWAPGDIDPSILRDAWAWARQSAPTAPHVAPDAAAILATWTPGGRARWTDPRTGLPCRGALIGWRAAIEVRATPATLLVELWAAGQPASMIIPMARLLRDPCWRHDAQPPPDAWLDYPAAAMSRWTLEGAGMAIAGWVGRWGLGTQEVLRDESGQRVVAWLLPAGWVPSRQPHDLPGIAMPMAFWRAQPNARLRTCGTGPGWSSVAQADGVHLTLDMDFPDTAEEGGWGWNVRRAMGRPSLVTGVRHHLVPWKRVPSMLAALEVDGWCLCAAPAQSEAARAATQVARQRDQRAA